MNILQLFADITYIADQLMNCYHVLVQPYKSQQLQDLRPSKMILDKYLPNFISVYL